MHYCKLDTLRGKFRQASLIFRQHFPKMFKMNSKSATKSLITTPRCGDKETCLVFGHQNREYMRVCVCARKMKELSGILSR